MMYEYTDIAIKDLNRRYIRLFNRLKLLPFDELNAMQSAADVIKEVSAVYDKAVKLAKRRYLDIAIEAYIVAFLLAFPTAVLTAAPTYINEDWVLDYLEEYDPVTLYRFIPEVDRKKQRLIEALVASNMKNAEVDKALRYWVLQSTQYADGITDRATLAAYKDAGVKKVMWESEDDIKVCSVCEKRNGTVYEIDKVPDKPHFRCRCWLVPVR